MKVLWFHGAGSTASIFSQITSNLRKKMGRDFTHRYLEGTITTRKGGRLWDRSKQVVCPIDEQVVVVGFSQGAERALCFAQNNPDRVSAVVAFSPPAPIVVPCEKCSVPLLLVTSDEDQYVFRKYSLKWVHCFEETTEILHEKGHKAGLPNPFNGAIVDWLTKNIN